MPFPWMRKHGIEDKLTFEFEKIKKIMSLNVQQPPIQRSIIPERVEHLKELFAQSFNPIVPLYFCVIGDAYYIIDGQHRYEVYKTMYDNYSVKVPCCYIYVETMDQVEDCFFAINDRLPLNEMWLQPFEIKQIIRDTFQYFEDNYPDMFRIKKKMTVRRPYIDKEIFKQNLTQIFEEDNNLNIRSSDDLIKKMLALEEEYATLDPDDFPAVGKTCNTKLINDLRKMDQYLHFGLVKAEWHIHLIHGIPHNTEGSQSHLPKSQLLKCWEREYGNCSRASCYVCGVHEITLFNCHAGHIIARARGGKTIIDNIIPICASCNHEMGTEHLEDYKRKHYGA